MFTTTFILNLPQAAFVTAAQSYLRSTLPLISQCIPVLQINGQGSSKCADVNADLELHNRHIPYEPGRIKVKHVIDKETHNAISKSFSSSPKLEIQFRNTIKYLLSHAICEQWVTLMLLVWAHLIKPIVQCH